MAEKDPSTEGGEEVGIDNARSPAPDAAPEDNPQPDALAGDVEITSGTGIDMGGTGDNAPVHSPTIPDDEGKTGDAQGEGKAADAAGNVAHGNPEAPEVDHA